MSRFWVLLFVLLAVTLFSPAAYAHRVALIIGNDRYTHFEPLNNAVKDAQMIGRVTKELGFTDVRVVLDASADIMRAELEAFYDRASGADVAFIYFAGHGFTLRQREAGLPESGYTGLIAPTDFDGASSNGIAMANAVLAGQRAKRIVVAFDACRSRLSPQQIDFVNVRIGTRMLMSVVGIEPMARENLLFISSTQNDATALDGPVGDHSPFALELARLMRERDQSQGGFGERLRQGVQARTGGRQTPFVQSTLRDPGNPFIAGPEVRANPYAGAPRLTSSAVFQGARDAAVDREGRLIVLTQTGVVGDNGRNLAPGAIALSPDGSKVLVLRDGELWAQALRGRWSTPRRAIREPVVAADVADDGRYITASAAGGLVGYNHLTRGYWPRVAQDRLSAVGVSHGSDFIYYGARDGTVCAYNASMLMDVWCTRTISTVHQIVESPTTETLITLSGQSRVHLRSTRGGRAGGGRLITEIEVDPAVFVTSVNYARDGMFFVVGTEDGGVSIWNAESATRVAALPHSNGWVASARFSQDGDKIIVTRRDGTVQVWGFSGG